MPDDVNIQYNELASWVPPTEAWATHEGRVTLAGDAAHSMPPHRGQGLNNAINDAYNLVEAVKGMNDENRAQVMQAYSQEVAERGGKEVKMSRATADAMLDYTAFRQSALLTKGLEKA